MAIAMSRQVHGQGTASAIMGSMQFGCGLLCGVILNFLLWSALFEYGHCWLFLWLWLWHYVFKLELLKSLKIEVYVTILVSLL